MTPQEQQMLDGLIDRVRTTQLPAKDSDAERRIQDTLGRDPNALYILCQTVLVQGYALEQAQKQLADQKQQQNTQQDKHQPSFLEKIFGRSEPDAPQAPPQSGYGQQVGDQPQYGQPGYVRPGYNQPAPGQPQYGQPVYNQPTGYPPMGYPPQAYPAQTGYGGGGFGGGFGGGGFLQGALQTAAGVAMGELAFQSIEGLFHGFGHAAGYGSDRAMGLVDTDSGNSNDFGQGDGFFSREQAENGVNNQLSSDIEDRRGDSSGDSSGDDTSRGFFGGDGNDDSNSFANSDDSATDSGYDVDNSATEDNGSDFTGDSGSFDDGGSYSDDNS